MTPDHTPLKVLVTGAAGYVGRHVTRALLEHGHDVTAVVRSERPGVVDGRARIVEADLLSRDTDVAALTDEVPDVVVHLAWQAGFAHNSHVHMERLSDHFRVLERWADAGVGRIAALGSMHEIGYHEGMVSADTPTAPLSLYGIAKDALRRVTIEHLGSRTETTWLRAYYIFGDDRRNQSIFTRLLAAADEGQTTFPFTSGRNAYDFIRVEALGEQIAVASTHPGGTGIIEVCSGEPTTLGEQVERFIADNDLGIALEYGAFPDRPYDSPVVYGDASRIRSLLGAAAG